METLGKITTSIIILILGFFLSLLLTHIVISIANLYQISYITQFSFVQLFGIIIIITLLKYTHSYKEPKEDVSYTNMFIGIVTNACLYLLMWGFAFIAHHILK